MSMEDFFIKVISHFLGSLFPVLIFLFSLFHFTSYKIFCLTILTFATQLLNAVLISLY